MAKQKSAHEIVQQLLATGYSYRELAVFYELSPSTLHCMDKNNEYRESAAMRDLLNSKKPRFKPRKNP